MQASKFLNTLFLFFALVFGLRHVCAHKFNPTTYFTEKEREHVVQYWNTPGRYTVTSPQQSLTEGPWKVRLSTEGSLWLKNYDRARQAGSAPPTKASPPRNQKEKEWEAWINAKIEYDHYLAQKNADAANVLLGFKPNLKNQKAKIPVHPGLIPKDLLTLSGNPPSFANVVTPLKYIIQFDENYQTVYLDNVYISTKNFRYYRHPTGVNHSGKRLSQYRDSELRSLCEEAGISETEQNVMKAIALLEGGFESVNTYDTGYISAGFVQFTTMSSGDGTLCGVLKEMKNRDINAFNLHFRRFGIDVTLNEKGEPLLVVVDPSTGSELLGRDAVTKIIQEPRLAAVFQRAGELCHTYKIAQLIHAKRAYYPGEKNVVVYVRGKRQLWKVSDIIQSEAGLATVMDRKVNTGNMTKLQNLLAQLIAEKEIRTPEQVLDYERELIQNLIYRKNFLADRSLSQPRKK